MKEEKEFTNFMSYKTFNNIIFFLFLMTIIFEELSYINLGFYFKIGKVFFQI